MYFKDFLCLVHSPKFFIHYQLITKTVMYKFKQLTSSVLKNNPHPRGLILKFRRSRAPRDPLTLSVHYSFHLSFSSSSFSHAHVHLSREREISENSRAQRKLHLTLLPCALERLSEAGRGNFKAKRLLGSCQGRAER